MLCKGNKGVNDSTRAPDVGPAEAGGGLASSLLVCGGDDLGVISLCRVWVGVFYSPNRQVGRIL